MDVGIVTVGDELLAGNTVNTNAAWLGKELTDKGVRVRRMVVVPDDRSAIASTIRQEHERWDRLVVTGGIGPTHDDVTMEAVAAALSRPMEENNEAREWLIEGKGYQSTDLVDGTTRLPAGADPIHNEVGVAPGAVIDAVIVLPGVPKEMRSMFRSIADEFHGQPLLEERVVIDEAESALIDRFETLQARFDVALGSYPGEFVEARIKGENPEEVKAAARWLRKRVRTASPEDKPEPDQRNGNTQKEHNSGS